ncbi:NAD(P)-dependent oxidoreductase [Litoricolaceae bacterium]|nr:NAD(P)-dependent oxidoreductase [Litorivicinaceae bacterium]
MLKNSKRISGKASSFALSRYFNYVEWIVMKVAVLGGSGFLGRNLIADLSCHPAIDELVSADLVVPESPFRLNSKVQFMQGDLGDHHFLVRAVDGCNVVWIKTGMLGGPQSASVDLLAAYACHNALTIKKIADACVDAGVDLVCFDSTEQVFGTGKNPDVNCEAYEPSAPNYYGASKLIAEKILKSKMEQGCFKRGVKIFRYSRVREAVSEDAVTKMVRSAFLDQNIFIYGDPEQQIDYIDMKDATKASVRALWDTRRFSVYHFSTGSPISLWELAHLVGHEVGRLIDSDISITCLPSSARKFQPLKLGMRVDETIETLQLPKFCSVHEMVLETVTHFNRLNSRLR